MAKQKSSNAFTMMQSMIVLLIVCLLGSAFSSFHPKAVLGLAMKEWMEACLQTQEKAYINKERKTVQFETNMACFDDLCLNYPAGIFCSPYSFHYNERGNISKAGTLTCHQGSKSGKLVFQLGTGRIRFELE